MRVAVLGTGAIGAGMTRALLREKFDVTVWNRTAARTAPLAEAGAKVAASPAEAVADADVCVLVVFDTAAVLAVLDDIRDVVPASTPVILSATVGQDIDIVAETAATMSITLVDAPVLGNPGPAERGELSIMASTTPPVRPIVQPVLDALAARVTWVGERPGPASRLKLVCNCWLAALNVSMAQAMALATGLGLDPRDFVTVVSASAASSPYLAYRAPMALGEDDAVMSPIDAILKDVRLIEQAIRDAGLDPAFANAVKALYERSSERGHGAEDMATVISSFRPEV